MKINQQQSPSIAQGDKSASAATTAAERNEVAAAQAPAPSQPGPAKDSIHISELSTKIHELESQLSANGAFDPAKVDRIKQAIRDGSMTVNPEAVADKMIANLQEMFSRAQEK